MKTKEEIEDIANKEYEYYINGYHMASFTNGYIKCQEDLTVDIYSKIENLIMTWSIDGTQTAGTLTRQIIKLLNPQEND